MHQMVTRYFLHKVAFFVHCTIAFAVHQVHSETKRVVPPPPTAFRVGGFFNPVPAMEKFEKF
jgi:hypothetical protein